MNRNTHTRQTSTSVRRAVPALVIVTLAIGLGACQTPRNAVVPEPVPAVQPAPVPEGVDLSRPADRIAEQLARQAVAPPTHFPTWTDRITAQIEYEATLTVSPSVRFRGVPADRVAERLQREQAQFRGMTADRIAEQLNRQTAGAPVYF